MIFLMLQSHSDIEKRRLQYDNAWVGFHLNILYFLPIYIILLVIYVIIIIKKTCTNMTFILLIAALQTCYVKKEGMFSKYLKIIITIIYVIFFSLITI